MDNFLVLKNISLPSQIKKKCQHFRRRTYLTIPEQKKTEKLEIFNSESRV